MQDIFIVISLAFSGILLILVAVKFTYFIRAGRSSLSKFIGSFFKWYGLHRLSDASARTRRYLKASNRINMVFWLFFFLAAAGYVLHRKVVK